MFLKYICRNSNIGMFFPKGGFSDDLKYVHDIPSVRIPYKNVCNDMYS